MENGRVKDTIRERAIWKKVKKYQPGFKAQNSQTVSMTFSKEVSSIVMVSDTVSAPVRLLKEERGDYIKVQMDDILNRVYTNNARPVTMTVIIILPENTQETCLRFLMDCLLQIAVREKIEISDVKAECSKEINHALLMVTVLGKKNQKDSFDNMKAFLPDKELVMIGAAALEGMVMLRNAGEEELKQRFSHQFLEHIENLSLKTQIGNMISLVRETEKEAGIYCIGRSGVFGALWEIASKSKKGFLVELLDIPIYQETIEICEFFNVNPYRIPSAGAILTAVNHGKTLVDRCIKAGLLAAVIGSIRDNADKLVCNGEERRYLDMPTAVKIEQNIPKDLEWIY